MNLPEEFINRMLTQLGEADAHRLVEALTETQPVTSVRFNGDMSIESLPLESRVPWSKNGWYLSERPSFTLDPLFHAGRYYVQEASSMFLEHALRSVVHGPVRMLDLCAAPGGKSTLAASVLEEGSLLVANEIQRGRARILAENLIKWAHDGVMVTSNSPLQIGNSGLQFDVMLTDVPCSGEGMFRKDDEAVADWSPAAVDMCVARQREILTDVWPALKPGGYLIYSTCTFNVHEDEENVQWIASELGAKPVALDVPAEWNISGACKGFDLPVYHFFPHRTRGEGFFLAVLQKDGDASAAWKSVPVTRECSECREWIKDGYSLEMDCGSVIARPKALAADMKAVQSKLYALVKGTEVAVSKGKDLQPAHALALSAALSPTAFRQVDLDLQQALDYLHGDALRLPTDVRDYVLLRFGGAPLGFVKNLGNRANNLYPQEWRIRMNVR